MHSLRNQGYTPLLSFISKSGHELHCGRFFGQEWVHLLKFPTWCLVCALGQVVWEHRIPAQNFSSEHFFYVVPSHSENDRGWSPGAQILCKVWQNFYRFRWQPTKRYILPLTTLVAGTPLYTAVRHTFQTWIWVSQHKLKVNNTFLWHYVKITRTRYLWMIIYLID